LALLLQLERKRNKRRLAVRRLQEEHDQLLLQSKAMDLLVQHQDIVARSALLSTATALPAVAKQG
jgi:hypothetical protein